MPWTGLFWTLQARFHLPIQQFHPGVPQALQGIVYHHQHCLGKDRFRRLPWSTWSINRIVTCSNFSHHVCFHLLFLCLWNSDSLQLETCFTLFLLDFFPFNSIIIISNNNNNSTYLPILVSFLVFVAVAYYLIIINCFMITLYTVDLFWANSVHY